MVEGAIWATVGIVATLIVTHFYYRRQRVRKILCWTSENFELLTKHSIGPPDVKVMKGTHTIARPLKIYLYVWNGGNSAITERDIPSAAPLTVQLKRAEIFDVGIARATKPSAKAVALKTSTVVEGSEGITVQLRYEYLNPGDGVTVEFLIGREEGFSLARDMIVTADLKGDIAGLRKVAPIKRKEKNAMLAVAIGLLFLALITGVEAFFGHEYLLEAMKTSPLGKPISELIESLAFIVPIFYVAAFVLFGSLAILIFAYYLDVRRSVLPKSIERSADA